MPTPSSKLGEAREVEFRGAADDNLTVWVNGQRVFGFEEYRNGVRFDRHRFKVRLQGRDEHGAGQGLPGAARSADAHRTELGVPAADLRCGREGVDVQGWAAGEISSCLAAARRAARD